MRRLSIAWVALPLLLLLAAVISTSCSRPIAPAFASDEDHFLFGSIGAEERTGVPYWIWLVLPRIFPEHLPAPGGYAAAGIPWREGHEMPVGLTKVTDGDIGVGVNCAMCHTTVEWRPSAPPIVRVSRTPRPDAIQSYRAFLFASASDPRFTSSRILGEIAKQHELSMFERLRYRFIVIPQTRRRLRDMGKGGSVKGDSVQGDWKIDHDFAAWSTDAEGLKRAQSHLK